MAYNELTIDFSKVKKFQERWNALPKKSEYEANNYLWNEGGDVFKTQVLKFMPRSNKDKSKVKKAPKVHAKDVESLDKIPFNLGIKVQTKLKPSSKDFGYLIFPDEGRGKHQKRKGEQAFFGRTLETKTDEVADGLLSHLNNKIEEELQ